MSKGRKQPKSTIESGRSPAGGGGGLGSTTPGGRGWYEEHGKALKFVGVGILWVIVFYVLATRQFFKEQVFPRYLSANAHAAGVILNTFGEPVTVYGQVVRSTKPPRRFSIEVARGCDAVEPSALFCAAVLASPVPWISRLVAIAVGTSLLMALNFIRVVSLFLVGVYVPRYFDTMHLEVWQVLFIGLAVLFWGLWAGRMAKRGKVRLGHGAS